MNESRTKPTTSFEFCNRRRFISLKEDNNSSTAANIFRFGSVVNPRRCGQRGLVMDKMDLYLTRRVKELLAAGWDRARIVQQLEALSTRKKIQELIQQISQ